jgi:hypothetical protein
MFTLYLLTDPTGADTAYIGQTRYDPKVRLYQHLHDISGNTRNRKCQWIQTLKTRGLCPILTVLDTDIPDAEIKQAEMDAIAMCIAIRGTDCVNRLTDAGFAYSLARP